MAMPRGPDSVVGSKDYACDDCGRIVAVAPSGQKIIREQDATVVCPPCMKKRIENDPDPEFMPPTPDQLAEIAAHMRRN